jgi:hypothetical protein
MSECEREAERLRQHVVGKESAGCQELEDEIARIQHKVRCARRAAGLMALLTAIGAAGFVYPSVLLENYSSIAPRFVVNLTYAVCAGSLISLAAFAGLASLYRKRLRRRKEACRQLAASLFESPLAGTDNTILRTIPPSTVGVRINGILQTASAADDVPSNL